MHRLVIICLCIIISIGSASNVHAIINGVPDGSNHPYVGLVIADLDGAGFVRCTGTLLSPTVVLTAGHCLPDDMTGGRIWFDEDVSVDPSYPYAGGTSIEAASWFRHPLYAEEQSGGSTSIAYDIGIIILAGPVVMPVYGDLPSAGQVETLPKKTGVDLVGYGLTEIRGQTFSSDLKRRYAPADLRANRQEPTVIKVTSSTAQGKGGACFGDGGGPNLLGGTNVVLAVNSTYSENCKKNSNSARLDHPDILDFINSFLGF